VNEPLTHSHGDRLARRGQRCRCSACGVEETCSPRFDFYTRSKDDTGPLFCWSCLVGQTQRDVEYPF
jgi:hypothetical protein